MSRKVHLRQTVKGRSACSVRAIRANGSIVWNNRDTYRYMASEVVDPQPFRDTPAAHRCAHCEGKFTEVMNRRRAALGMPLYADAMTMTLQAHTREI